MLTRCPACQAVFRVTPAQLRVRAGDVRCGKCQHVFNALEHWVDETSAAPAAPVTATTPASAVAAGPVNLSPAVDVGITPQAAAKGASTLADIAESAPAALSPVSAEFVPEPLEPSPVADVSLVPPELPEPPESPAPPESSEPPEPPEPPDSPALCLEPLILPPDSLVPEAPMAAWQEAPAASQSAAPLNPPLSPPLYIEPLLAIGPDHAARAADDSAPVLSSPAAQPPDVGRLDAPTLPPAADLDFAPESAPATEPAIEPSTEPAPATDPLSPEALREAARAAGLVAAREQFEAPSYNRWASSALAGSDPMGSAAAAAAGRSLWPFVLMSLVLVLLLAGQAAYHYRGALAASQPALRPWLVQACALLHCELPLPREVTAVSIVASDLQSDPARGGMLVLTATLRNSAEYAQDWPALELTLTDTRDHPLLRRVLLAEDYLPPEERSPSFAARREIPLRLWLKAGEEVASGYRLYVFYP